MLFLTLTVLRSAFSSSAAVQMKMAGSRRFLQQSTFKKDWLSDPSTYPIMFVLTFATTLAGTFIFRKVAYCPDVRVTSIAKGHVVRTWA